MTLEIVETFFEFRSLQKIENPLYRGNFLFLLSQSLGKINELDTPAEKYLDKFSQTLRESTDRYFPFRQLKIREPKNSWKKILYLSKINFIRYGSKQNPKNTMRNTKRKEARFTWI